MTKQLVLQVYVAGISRTCEFMVPADMPVRTATALMHKLLADEYGVMMTVLTGRPQLICAQSGEVLNESMSLRQSGVDGSMRLILA